MLKRPRHKWLAFEYRSDFDFGPVISGIYVNALGLAAFVALSWFLTRSLAVSLAIVPLLLIHEGGHAWAMRRYGLGVSRFIVMPPFGLAVAPDEPWRSRKAEADIALAGPLWGLGTAIFAAAMSRLTGHAFWSTVTVLACAVNLFNLIPVNPLDGGRVVKSIAWSVAPVLGIAVQALGLLAAVGITMAINPFIGLFIIYFGAREFIAEYKALKTYLAVRKAIGKEAAMKYGEAGTLPRMTAGDAVLRGLAYLMLIAALASIMLLSVIVSALLS